MSRVSSLVLAVGLLQWAFSSPALAGDCDGLWWGAKSRAEGKASKLEYEGARDALNAFLKKCSGAKVHPEKIGHAKAYALRYRRLGDSWAKAKTAPAKNGLNFARELPKKGPDGRSPRTSRSRI